MQLFVIDNNKIGRIQRPGTAVLTGYPMNLLAYKLSLVKFLSCRVWGGCHTGLETAAKAADSSQFLPAGKMPLASV
jgi:hypothetical protein